MRPPEHVGIGSVEQSLATLAGHCLLGPLLYLWQVWARCLVTVMGLTAYFQ